MSAKTITCPYCGAQMEDDAGAFYHQADCHRRDATARLERASYVGD